MKKRFSIIDAAYIGSGMYVIGKYETIPHWFFPVIFGYIMYLAVTTKTT